MPTFPCDKHILCPAGGVPSLDYDPPGINLSSEAPDGTVFIASHLGDNNGGSGPNQPNLGSDWTVTGCDWTCVSYVSLEAALQCAENKAVECNDCTGDQCADPPPPDCPPGSEPCTIPPNVPGGGGGPGGGGSGGKTPSGGGGTPDKRWEPNDQQVAIVKCPDGTPFYYIQYGGSFVADTKARANEMALSFGLIQAQKFKVCMGDLQTHSCLGTFYDDLIVGSLGAVPYSFTLGTGMLPPGLTLTAVDAVSARVSGTPMGTGSFDFSIQLSDASGHFIVKSFTINVMGITITTLPSGTVGTPYFQTIVASGGTAPYTYAVDGPILPPPGLALNSAGVLFGTPTTPGNSGFNVKVTDADGASCVQTITVPIIGIGLCQLCAFSSIKADANFIAEVAGLACFGSIAPEWDGTFPLSDTNPDTGNKFFYFVDRAILGKAVSADETADYPAGLNWRRNEEMTGLYYEGGLWRLKIKCVDDPTPAWEGTFASADPNDPTGIYTRVSGAILDDKVEIRSASAPTCRLLAWYTFEALTGTPPTGDSAGLPAAANRTLLGGAEGGTGSINTVVGKVGNAVQLLSEGGLAMFQGLSNKPELAFHDQVTFTGWANVTELVAEAHNKALLSYTWPLAGGGSDQINLWWYHPALDVGQQAWQINQFLGAHTDVAFSAGWHFFVFSYDRTTGQLSIEIDRGGATTLAGAARGATDISAGVLFEIQAHPDGPGSVDFRMDELAVWDGLLSATELDWLYNAGAGRTYPPASPPF